jgi:dTDP-6-deoxy-L-talose 4-dehydrogenase (NAD+)
MKIAVTGANGYLGQGIVKQLLDDGIEVIAVDFNTNNVDKRAKKIDCDLFELDNPFDYFEEPDVVLHLAWRNGFVHNSDTHLIDLNSHCNFIKKLIEGGIKRIAIMGTMHEIGFFEGSVNENTPCNPRNMYGIAKNAFRQIVTIFCENANVTLQWLRGYYMVGNVKFGCSIFSKLSIAEKEGNKLFPFTSGLNQCDFIDYDDFCLQTAAAVEQDEITGIINICSGRPRKLSEVVEKFIEDNNFKIKLDYGKFLDRPYDSKAIWGNSKKIEIIMKRRKEK